ncbi:MAG: Gfo/Idh/MocA family oxidoreductase [Actinomycetia bacterium]|nr:Gfo/Idh/MocA family oxidoreductase [Actinomycetes bacterium]MCP4228278.1 Gfo/Idh/MocA family oxidoreductase [Actinomycetes bacterium]
MTGLRIGFIGCGLIARTHARGLSGLPDIEIGPVTDIDQRRAVAFAAELPAATVVTSPSEVIANSDAVYVCTWTAAHPPLVEQAAEAGRAVFCEKPLAVDLETAQTMTDAVEQAGVINQVGLVLRHSPAFRWLAARINEPQVGPLMSVVFRDDQYLPIQGLYGSTWRADKTKAGAGTLLEHSIHDLDLLSWMMGPIASVSANHTSFHGLDGIEDQASVMLVAVSGAQATLTSVWHDVLSRPSQRRVEAFCQRAVLTLEGDWNGPVWAETTNGPEDPIEGSRLSAFAANADKGGTNPDADFVAAVTEGRPAKPDFGLALEAHRLADAAYRSAQANGTPMNL